MKQNLLQCLMNIAADLHSHSVGSFPYNSEMRRRHQAQRAARRGPCFVQRPPGPFLPAEPARPLPFTAHEYHRLMTRAAHLHETLQAVAIPWLHFGAQIGWMLSGFVLWKAGRVSQLFPPNPYSPFFPRESCHPFPVLITKLDHTQSHIHVRELTTTHPQVKHNSIALL